MFPRNSNDRNNDGRIFVSNRRSDALEYNCKTNPQGKRYLELLRSEKYVDCEFIVCEKKIKCHKLILGAASPVFEAMLFGPLCDRSNQIEIDDISAEVFKVLIEYIYCDQVLFDNLTLEQIFELYYAAEKYILNSLITHCQVAIKSKLRFDNILPALELSVCMHISGLLNTCLAFFKSCCIQNPQYLKYLKDNYIHVSKECLTSLMHAYHEPSIVMVWYTYEWLQQERITYGSDITPLDFDMHQLGWTKYLTMYEPVEFTRLSEQQQLKHAIKLIERCYFKACRPFTIDTIACEWRMRIITSRFIKLMGLVLNSRLTPNLVGPWTPNVPAEYEESLRIDIRNVSPLAQSCEQSENDAANNELLWTHIVRRQSTKYNCELHINWMDHGIVLEPDVMYEIKLGWDASAYGAEYPCSLQSTLADNIKFIDDDNFNGSMIKGIRFIELS